MINELPMYDEIAENPFVLRNHDPVELERLIIKNRERKTLIERLNEILDLQS